MEWTRSANQALTISLLKIVKMSFKKKDISQNGSVSIFSHIKIYKDLRNN